jgi:CO/xanthine dehydrogenase FAD-binding subunit
MRAYVPGYQLTTPASLNDALALIGNEPGVWKPFAGGTDLMVLLEAGKLPHRNYVNIWPLSELRGIEITDEHVTLCQAASETGGLAIQNRGTLGGNVVNASPAADSPPALLAYAAEIELVSTGGSRWLPYDGFHTGYKQMTMHANELLSRIRLPRRSSNVKHYYRKVGTRKAQAISKVCFAGVSRMEGTFLADVRVVLGSVAPIVLRCKQTEDAIRGKELNDDTVRLARETLLREIVPIDDVRSTADYRMRVAANLLVDFLVTARS